MQIEIRSTTYLIDMCNHSELLVKPTAQVLGFVGGGNLMISNCKRFITELGQLLPGTVNTLPISKYSVLSSLSSLIIEIARESASNFQVQSLSSGDKTVLE